MIFRRRSATKQKTPAADAPSSLFVRRTVLVLAVLVLPITRWSRIRRAMIVLVGLPIAVVLMWSDFRGLAALIGLTTTALFWLAALPVLPSPVDAGSADQPPYNNAENE